MPRVVARACFIDLLHSGAVLSAAAKFPVNEKMRKKRLKKKSFEIFKVRKDNELFLLFTLCCANVYSVVLVFFSSCT